jgi:ubiquinone biosynthesis protein UbiJ
MAPNEQPELKAVLQNYTAASKHYALALAELNRQRATISADEYRRFYEMVEDAREDCERLRTTLSRLKD